MLDRMLHESQNLERFSRRQQLGAPVPQGEPLATCRFNERPRFDKPEQRLQRPQADKCRWRDGWTRRGWQLQYDTENTTGLQRGGHAWKQQGPLEILQDESRVNQIEGLTLEHDVGQIGAPDVKFKTRIRKPFAEPKQIRWIQVDNGNVGGYLRVDVLQSVAC